MTKRTIELPFTPEEWRDGTVQEKAKTARIDAAYERVLGDGSLANIRRKLSVDDLRRLIRVLID